MEARAKAEIRFVGVRRIESIVVIELELLGGMS